MTDDTFDELDLVRNLRRDLDADTPMHLLYSAAMISEMAESGEEPNVRVRDLANSMIEVAEPETDALLLVWAEMLGDDLLKRRIHRVVKPRAEVLPAWLAEIARLRPVKAVSLRSPVNTEETIVIEVRGPRGHFSIMAGLDLMGIPFLEDAYPLEDDIEQIRARVHAMAIPAGLRPKIVELSLADARARLDSAVEHAGRMFPPVETDTWPAMQPLLEWQLRLMPTGGRGFELDEWDDERRDALEQTFLDSPHAAGLDAESASMHVSLLIDFACNYGTGDPRQWSNVLVQRMLLELIPRKVLYPFEDMVGIPATMSRFIDFAHGELDVAPDFTEHTQRAIGEAAPQYLSAIARDANAQSERGQRMRLVSEIWPEGLEVVGPAAPGFSEPTYEELALRTRERMAAEVGGLEAFESLGVEPLPSGEDVALELVSDDIVERVKAVAQMITDVAGDFFQDPEMVTASLRTLTLVAASNPASILRGANDANTAATVCWISGRNNEWFDRSVKGRTINAMKEAFGTRADLPARAVTMLKYYDTALNTTHRLALGDPQLLTSTRRMMLVDWREKSDLLLTLARQADQGQR